MSFERRTRLHAAAILLIGLVAFFFCQFHLTDDHEYGPDAGESCQIAALSSALTVVSSDAGPDRTSAHGDRLDILIVAENFKGISSNLASIESGPPLHPNLTSKRYRFTRVYRL